MKAGISAFDSESTQQQEVKKTHSVFGVAAGFSVF